jgi:membrane protease YdiL (CAAX protease family)
MLSHNYWILVPDIARFLGGILYGTLYILSKRNLAVPTIAHSIHNILIVIGFYEYLLSL